MAMVLFVMTEGYIYLGVAHTLQVLFVMGLPLQVLLHIPLGFRPFSCSARKMPLQQSSQTFVRKQQCRQ